MDVSWRQRFGTCTCVLRVLNKQSRFSKLLVVPFMSTEGGSTELEIRTTVRLLPET